MKSHQLDELRLLGFAPKTMLDIGANLGGFTTEFLRVFPQCKPTLIEPNPHCLNSLRKLPFEILPYAASSKNGQASLFLTKEWLQSTGASLYRENTPFFRDEVAITHPVQTVRLDDVLGERAFDFIKIDVQGSEYDVLLGGAQILKRATHILIEVPLVEYNIGAPAAEHLFKKLAEYGFRCADVVEFHRSEQVMNGALLQIDFLFERAVTKATQSQRLCGLHDEVALLNFLKVRKARTPDFTVIDIGDTARPWTADVADATFHKNSNAAADLHFPGNISDAGSWNRVLEYVHTHGKFSYGVCSHALASTDYPALALEMLPRVAEAGCISTPSKFAEMVRAEGPYRGFVRSRWILCHVDDTLTLFPKIPVIDYLKFPGEESWKDHPEKFETQIFWRKGLSFSVLNNDLPQAPASKVIEAYADILARAQ